MSSTTLPNYSLAQLAELVGAQLCLGERANGKAADESAADISAAEISVTGIAPLATATQQQVSFLSNRKYRPQLETTQAAAVILDSDSAAHCPVHCLVHSNPYLAFARLSHAFSTRPSAAAGIHPSAHISDSASVGKAASIGAGVVIMEGVSIGDQVTIGPNTVIEADVVIGDRVTLMANVTLYHAVTIGSDVTVHAGAVIGSDGFGYAPNPELGDSHGYGWQKIAQLGSVSIGNRVEIGANTTIDRGALDDTVIEDDVIIDNQVQIAHNCVIGKGTAIAGCVGMAGSSGIGNYCSIGGGAGIAGHLSIADGTTVMGMTLINRSVTKPGAYASGTGMQDASSWRKSAVRFTQLDSLNQRVKALEKQVKKQP